MLKDIIEYNKLTRNGRERERPKTKAEKTIQETRTEAEKSQRDESRKEAYPGSVPTLRLRRGEHQHEHHWHCCKLLSPLQEPSHTVSGTVQDSWHHFREPSHSSVRCPLALSPRYTRFWVEIHNSRFEFVSEETIRETRPERECVCMLGVRRPFFEF